MKMGIFEFLFTLLYAQQLYSCPWLLVHNPWELMGLRFTLGIAQAGIIPAIATLLKKNVSTGVSGRIFGVNQEAQYLGFVIGFLLGSQISSHFGFVPIFFSMSLLLMINLIIIMFISRTPNAKLT